MKRTSALSASSIAPSSSTPSISPWVPALPIWRTISGSKPIKQVSASNGEKQTPYFIILAASLLQCYPKNSCCARLAFIDEAFSALSRERIEQMVKYFEENDFQVFYAAPPEKISSIGAFIQSTVSLVCTGRYTNAVEGLVKE